MKLGFKQPKRNSKKVTVIGPNGTFICACGLKISSSEILAHIPKCPANTEAARTLGAKGGSVKSKAKAQAARENGKLGGRPRKKKVRK